MYFTNKIGANSVRGLIGRILLRVSRLEVTSSHERTCVYVPNKVFPVANFRVAVKSVLSCLMSDSCGRMYYYYYYRKIYKFYIYNIIYIYESDRGIRSRRSFVYIYNVIYTIYYILVAVKTLFSIK